VAETEEFLLQLTRALKTAREELTTLEKFSYEVNISRSQMSKYEAGGDMLLSTFLKVFHGLGFSREELLKAMQRNNKEL
jgi:hypothetical protein